MAKEKSHSMFKGKKPISITKMAAYLGLTKQEIKKLRSTGEIASSVRADGKVITNTKQFLDYLHQNQLPLPKSFIDENEVVIVVVDDDDRIIKSLKLFFFSTCPGATVHYFKASVEAYNYIKESIPKLVILDIEMPKMDGLQLIGELNKQPDCNEIDFIILSGYIEKYKNQIDEYEIINYLSKPIRYKSLRDTLSPYIYSTNQDESKHV